MVEVANDFYGELNDVLSKVNSWALGREKELLSLQAEHTSFLDTHNDITMELKRREREAKAKVEKLVQDVERQQKQFQLLQKENAELVAVSDKLPVELEQLQAELESEKEAYENARSAVEQAEYARERKKKHLREGHELYESRLALKIQTSKKDGSIVIKMHKIDPSNPSRQFYFSILVVNDKYTVPECNPKIDELDRLVAKLNANESLSEFTAAVRKAWSHDCQQD